jgi:small subunit ribosomal protein S13
MARIAGVDLPRNKRVEIALTYIFGLGRHAANVVLDEAGVSPDKRTDDLDENDVRKIRDAIEQNYRVEGDLRRDTQMNIKRLMDLGAYRGTRHKKNLPSRGQRTHTNARTRKGPRRMAIKKQGAASAAKK